MKCAKCKQEFEDNLLQLSHDVPCYVFEGIDRQEKKKEADKHGRHYLCQKCHDMYEKMVFADMVAPFNSEIKEIMIHRAKQFSKRWFSDGLLH